MKRIPISIALAVAGLAFAIFYVLNSAKQPPQPEPVRPPTTNPYQQGLAGVGIVEALDDTIAVPPYRASKVTAVYVAEGDTVQAGDPLYKLDDAELSAQLEGLQAEAAVKDATLNRLRHEPRAEDLPPLQADVAKTQANLADLQAQLAKLESVRDARAISQDELSRKRYAVQMAQAQSQQAQAALNKAKAGAWQFDIAQTQAEKRALMAKTHLTQVQLGQSIIRAPRSGKVLQVNTHAGELVAANPTNLNLAPVLLGNNNQQQVRVDIDEVNASLVQPNMTAVASLKGNSQKQFPLRFVRIEPLMVPKKNLSGDNAERVDVRVLQLIYAFDPPGFPVYEGQQVDVFLKPATSHATESQSMAAPNTDAPPTQKPGA
jgi:HlyD family secretion protein